MCRTPRKASGIALFFAWSSKFYANSQPADRQGLEFLSMDQIGQDNLTPNQTLVGVNPLIRLIVFATHDDGGI